MDAARPIVTEIKARGQLTIPKKIRDWARLEEGQAVSIIPVGDALIITPRRLELEEARREIRRLLKESGCTLDELLEGLKAERASVYRDQYGQDPD